MRQRRVGRRGLRGRRVAERGEARAAAGRAGLLLLLLLLLLVVRGWRCCVSGREEEAPPVGRAVVLAVVTTGLLASEGATSTGGDLGLRGATASLEGGDTG